MADELVRAGIDPSRLVPAARFVTSIRPRPMPCDPPTSIHRPIACRSSVPAALRRRRLPRRGTSPPTTSRPTQIRWFAAVPPAAVLSNPHAAQAACPGQIPPGECRAGPGAAAPARWRCQCAVAEASRLVAQARLALDQGDLPTAARFAEQAEALNVPDNAFAQNEIRPWQMSLEVNRAMVRREGVVQASGNVPASRAALSGRSERL